uniref:Aminopeptidase N-like N-terminal domain-containing protein n=1 Tax=Ditylenchus dipsaci TaxID=166011 RepID=A0A915DYS1_9BILA
MFLDPLIPTFFGAVKIDFQLTRPITSTSSYKNENKRTKRENHTPSAENEDLPLSDTVINETQSGPNVPLDYSPLDGVELKFMSSNLEGFQNVTLKAAGSNRKLLIVDTKFGITEVTFLVAEPVLNMGRYTLIIERFQGIITYEKGVYYRDAGGFPVLGTDLFPNFTSAVFPCLGGPLTKTTLKLTIVHPKDTVAVSNMPQQEPMQSLNDNWKVSKFIQVPNLAAYMLSMAVLPSGVYERTIVSTQLPIYIWTNKIIHRPTLKQDIAKLAEKVYVSIYAMLNEQLPLSNLDVLVMSDYNGTHSFGLITISASSE